jgi:AraC family transcriptional regulator, exoenzyme S synthesis regulatory protein ExsA
MDIFNLPEDIFPDKNNTDTIIIHDYLAPAGFFSGKSVLHKNAISLVISGRKTMHFAEKMVNIEADEFHFLSAGNCLVSMKQSGKNEFRSILIFFDNRVLNDFYVKYDTVIAGFKNTLPVQNQPYIAIKKDAFVKNFITSLQLLLQSNQAISQEMKLLKFEELMLHILEKYPASLLSFQNTKNRDFNDLEIRKAVEANILNNINLEEMAFLCNMSLSTFKRRFAKIYGSPPNKWILQKRMEVARDLLLVHGEKPGEIFYKVGYENHSSFTQSFKQTFGQTPRDFQLQQLNARR